MLRRLVIALAAWFALFALAHAVAEAWACPWTELPQRAAALPPAAAVTALLVLYLARPILLLPAPVVCLAAGAAFGPWIGAVMTWVGENLGAQLAFGIARSVRAGGTATEAEGGPISAGWRAVLERRGTAAVVMLRLSFLPHDAINYGCGLTPVRFRDFALGTAIGLIPGVVVFSIAGGSIAGKGSGWTAAAVAAGTLAASATLAWSLWRSTPSQPVV